MKIKFVNCELRNEYESHFLSEKHYTKACSINSENKALTTAA